MTEEGFYDDPDMGKDFHTYEDPDIAKDIHDYIIMDPIQSKAEATKQLDQFSHVTLNIAITGESGVGKSTFVNALRGLRDEDVGAAKTGVTETTMQPMRYSHPTMPNVYIWDLPGIGTTSFKPDTYLKDVNFDIYDFFIIIGGGRFKLNDNILAKQIKKKKKMFYFVRSKIDNDIRAEAQKKNFDENTVLAKIRRSCIENLVDCGKPKVFLISTFDLGKYDFQKLVDSLEENLPDHKWVALIESLPVSSIQMIEKKKRMLYKTAGATAAGTATTTTIPIPGFSVGCEIGIITKYLQAAHITFGLDDDSIHRLAERVNKPEKELKSVIKSQFAEGVNATVVAAMLKTAAMTTAKTFETILATSFAGNCCAMAISFGTTLHLLRRAIKEMSEDAKAVIEAVGL